ncbi:MAG: hypothetical protein NC191_08005 [Muribaculaceae bacterium]|nr:hypothetical protein [Muribaculaceae bacterium]
MKKILILGILFATFNTIQYTHACPIDKPCKADIGAGINDKLPNKILPDNLNKQIQPNNTMNNRTNLGQPSLPENINMRPVQQESTQPYNANCQFGNCLNNQDSDTKLRR